MMTDFKSNEASARPAASPDRETELEADAGISNLIPQFVSDICKEPNSVELRVSYDAPTLQSTYYYSITWEEKEDHEGKYKDKLENKMVPKVVSSAPTPTHRSYHGLTPVLVQCDGPCKKEFKSNYLNTIGRCDHLLCAACYGVVRNQDGTNGCSAVSCNWKGENKREAKRFFEKEICQKQRIRAREMKALNIDVKSASTASSTSNSNKSLPSTPTQKSGNSETDCSVLSKTYPVKGELTHVKLIILEEGKEKLYTELEAISNSKINKVITKLILQKYKSLPRHHRGVLYHVEPQANHKKKAVRVRTAKYNSADLFEFSQVNSGGNHLVFILDFGGVLKDGDEIKEEK